MLRLTLIASVVVFHQFHSLPALACGATPDEVRLLLPLESADEVPVNVALFASANLRSALEFEMIELGPPGEDAGMPERPVPLTVECQSGSGGALCVARPHTALKAQTGYSWRVKGEEPDTGALSWRYFVTGEATDEETIPELGVSVVRNVRLDSNGCGPDHLVTLSLENPGSTPVVVTVPELTPGYVMHAQVLGAQEPAVVWSLYGSPACFQVEVYDQTGERQLQPEICPDALSAPTTHEPIDEPEGVMDAGASEPHFGGEEADGGAQRPSVGEQGDEERPHADASAAGGESSSSSKEQRGGVEDASSPGSGGCALGGNSSPAAAVAWFFAFGLGLAGWRRRRADR